MIENKRMCIVTRELLNKDELIRFALSETDVCIDLDNKIQSRGAYIKNDEKVISELIKKRRISAKMKPEHKNKIIKLAEGLINE